jgi:glycosyltransferase involved in cell wall biosynthesis
MRENPLVSVIILTYRNFKYLKEAIDSVLIQTYSNIELIISDDSSPDFDIKAIEDLLKNKKENIKNVLIKTKEKNEGINSNINHALKFTSGEYIVLLDGDDCFYDDKVVSYIANFFIINKCLIAIGFRQHYDRKMEKFITEWPEAETVDFMKKTSPFEFYKFLASKGNGIIHASGMSFRSKLIEDYGNFDERYGMIEDWPKFLQLLRCGIKIHFMDKITVKYRLGGISTSSEPNIRYLESRVLVMKNEIFPYMDEFDFSSDEKELLKYTYFIRLSEIFRVRRHYIKYMLLTTRNIYHLFFRLRRRISGNRVRGSI